MGTSPLQNYEIRFTLWAKNSEVPVLKDPCSIILQNPAMALLPTLPACTPGAI